MMHTRGTESTVDITHFATLVVSPVGFLERGPLFLGGAIYVKKSRPKWHDVTAGQRPPGLTFFHGIFGLASLCRKMGLFLRA